MSEKETRKKKEPMSIKKIITIIIIVVLAMLMVGGIYYVIVLVAQSKAEKANAWGYYDGEAIAIENNNVFYNTLVNDSNLQTAYLNGDYQSLYDSYYGAYQAQVVFTALSKEAKQAKIVAPQTLVNELILRAGVYNGSDGAFSQEVYNSATETEKASVNTYYTNYYPYNLVLSDLQSTLVSAQEADFVKTLAEHSRSFEYFVIDYNVYPNELAIAYAEEHEGLFDTMDLSIISASTTEKLTEALNALNNGTAWEDVVSAYSEDGYASKGGSAGTVMMYSLIANLTDKADLEKITSLEQGTYSEPIASPYGYVIYKADKALSKADYSDEEIIATIKHYIVENDEELITPYIDTAVGLAADQAQNDFEAAAKAAGAEIVTVADVENNIGESQFLGGFAYCDSQGYLSAAAQDEALNKELFTAEVGYVTGAIEVTAAEHTSYIVAKVTEIRDDNTNNSAATEALYQYYAPLQPAYDRFYNVLLSDKHTDNFYSQFLSSLFSTNV